MRELLVSSSARIDVIDITDKVESAISEIGIHDGACIVYVPHATAGIIINEYEPNLKQDFIRMFEDVVSEDAGYKHNTIDDNAAAHLRSALIGPSVIVPLMRGKLMLGTWQRILLCEFDGPRKRKIYVSVLSVR